MKQAAPVIAAPASSVAGSPPAQVSAVHAEAPAMARRPPPRTTRIAKAASAGIGAAVRSIGSRFVSESASPPNAQANAHVREAGLPMPMVLRKKNIAMPVPINGRSTWRRNASSQGRRKKRRDSGWKTA